MYDFAVQCAGCEPLRTNTAIGASGEAIRLSSFTSSTAMTGELLLQGSTDRASDWIMGAVLIR
jgi:hypothetical protein